MRRSYSFILVFLFCSSFQDQWKNVYTESAWKDRDRWQRADDLIRSSAFEKEAMLPTSEVMKAT